MGEEEEAETVDDDEEEDVGELKAETSGQEKWCGCAAPGRRTPPGKWWGDGRWRPNGRDSSGWLAALLAEAEEGPISKCGCCCGVELAAWGVEGVEDDRRVDGEAE